MLAFAMSFAGGDVSLGGVILKKIIFFVTAIIIGWKIVPPALGRLAPLRVTQTVISAGLIICFIFAYMAEIAGVAPIIGAYIAGIAILSEKSKIDGESEEDRGLGISKALIICAILIFALFP